MRSKKDKQGYLIIFLVVAFLILLVAAKMKLDSKPKPNSDNCLGSVTSNTVILLDYTDEIPQQTKDEIAARAKSFINDKVATNERVSIFTISELSKKALKPILSICKPAEYGNRATEDVRSIKKRFENNFMKPIQEIFSVVPESSNQSPIAQAITDISLSQYLKGNVNNLMIFSDMIEHTDKFSMFRCSSSSNVIPEYRESRKGAQERPKFKNTRVELHIIPRLDIPESALNCRDKLWPWFFGDNEGGNAELTSEYLPGGVSIKNNNK